MKRTIISMIVCATFAIVPSAFALTSLTPDTMKSTTGQAGVSITLEDVNIETFTGSVSYTDDDGYLGADYAGGSIVISDRHTVSMYTGLGNGDIYAYQFSTATGGETAIGSITTTSPLTIDVGVCPGQSVSSYLNDNTVAVADLDAAKAAAVADTSVNKVVGVVIGLPTLMIATSADNYSVTVASDADSTTAAENDGAAYIAISNGASVTCILGGTIEIAPH